MAYNLANSGLGPSKVSNPGGKCPPVGDAEKFGCPDAGLVGAGLAAGLAAGDDFLEHRLPSSIKRDSEGWRKGRQ